MAPPIIALGLDAPADPAHLATHPTSSAPATLTCCGRAIWQEAATLALFCSAKAPASILLAVHDLAQQWRTVGPVLMGGFQSTVEEEALTILLRGPQPVVVWLARGMVKRPPPAWQAALEAGRLTLVTPFPETVHRATTETALVRNRLVAAAADAVFFAHAQPGSKSATLAHEVLGWEKPVYTLAHPANDHLLQLGMAVLDGDTVISKPAARAQWASETHRAS